MTLSLTNRLARLRDRAVEWLAWKKFCSRLAGPATSHQQIIVLQSSDHDYAPFLELTASVNRRYAALMGYGYKNFIGNISPRPQTANFNRYYLLREVTTRTSHQWALWMDADAIVIDPTVRLESIVHANRDRLIIACRGCDAGEHDINNGVFLFNLRHPLARRFLSHLIMAARRVSPNNSRFQSDQRHVQAWLRRRMEPDGRIRVAKRYAGSESDKFNYDGPFIQHVLRTWGTLEERLERLRVLRRACDEQGATVASNDLPRAT